LRLQPTSSILAAAFLVTVGALAGCRSAAPDSVPPDVTHTVAAETPEPFAAIEEVQAVAGQTVEGQDLTETLFEDESVAEPELALEAPATEPEELQRWALELCQSAEQLLAEGKAEEAVADLDQAYELMLQLPDSGDSKYLQAKEDIRLLVADLINRHYRSGRPETTRPTASWDLELPMVDNKYVQYEIERFTGAEREQFLEGYRRAGRYRPMILPRLEEAGLPSQLSWLPMVESWFKVRAYSRASAVGMWQFISSTGQRYGLSRDSWVDERYDPEKSTDAAIGYLTDLHGMFGDWPKALAGYNCGEARVARLQRRSQDEYMDFWDLYELLPRETRRYVPRLFAAIAIIENPEKYGMTLPEPDPPLDVVAVPVERAVKLEQLDALLGLSNGTLADLNPELRHKATPQTTYQLRIPAAREQTLLADLASIPEFRPQETQYETHRVSRGQTLSVIARRYGTSVSAIMQANNLRSANRISVGQRLRIPVRGPARVARTTRTATNGVHTVRRGESLGGIAQAYGTTVERIKRDNNLSSNLIHPGEQLRVNAASTQASTSSAGSSGKTYTVRSGDTPGAIADKHGVGLSALLQANRLGRRSTIYPGQQLVIP
jgi:membrane-bound lytic murein transglycosylase D